MNTVTFPREENPKLFDATYYPDGNKIVNEWFKRTQQEGLSWPEGMHNHLIEFTGDTNIKFNNMAKDSMSVNQFKSPVRYDIFNYLKGFNDKGFEQIIGTKGDWTSLKSIERGMKQAVQTLINQALGKRTYYSTDSRRTSGPDKKTSDLPSKPMIPRINNKASIKKKTGKLVGYGTRGGKRRKKKTRRKRGGMKKAATTKKASPKKTSKKPLKVDTTKYDDVSPAKKQSPHNQQHIADFKDSSNLPLKSLNFDASDISFIQDGGGPCLSKLCKNKEKERLLKRKESRKRFGSIPEEFDDMIDDWERFSNESRMEVEHPSPEIKPGLINDPFRNLVVRTGGGEQAINQERFEWIKKQAKKVLDNKEFLKELEASTNIKIKKNINEIKKKLEKTTLEEVLRFNKKINKNQKGGNGDDTNTCAFCLEELRQPIPSALWPFGPYTDNQGVVHQKCFHNRSFCINCLSKFSSFNTENQYIHVCPLCRAPRIRTQIERGMTLYHNLRDSVTLLDVGFLLTFVISSIMNVSDNNFTLGAFVLQGAIGLILWTIRDFNRDDRRQAQRRLNAQRRRQFPHFFDDDVLEGGGRKIQVKASSKDWKLTEVPKKNYYYLINIYWPSEGEVKLRYENVPARYTGLARDLYDGWDSREGESYVFTTLESLDDGWNNDGNNEWIGKVVDPLPEHLIPRHLISNSGGRRKKKTRRKIGGNNPNTDDCIICLDPLNDGKRIIDVHLGRKFHTHRHYFHYDCIERVVKDDDYVSTPCPLCNKPDTLHYRFEEFCPECGQGWTEKEIEANEDYVTKTINGESRFVCNDCVDASEEDYGGGGKRRKKKTRRKKRKKKRKKSLRK